MPNKVFKRKGFAKKKPPVSQEIISIPRFFNFMRLIPEMMKIYNYNYENPLSENLCLVMVQNATSFLPSGFISPYEPIFPLTLVPTLKTDIFVLKIRSEMVIRNS